MPESPIQVLLVDDSPLVLNILNRIFTRSPGINVVGTAADGHEAIDAIARLDPQVVCTDLMMPNMNGLELTRHIMEHCPRPILVVSSAVQEEDTDNVFELLRAGAVDVFPKPRVGSAAALEEVGDELIRKIRILAGVRVVRKRWRKKAKTAVRDPLDPDTGWENLDSTRNSWVNFGEDELPPQQPDEFEKERTFRIVTIGASTGGHQALRTVLWNLPADFPVPIVCVQHIGRGFLSGLVNWLNTKCRLSVRIAQNGEPAKAGNVYVAPDSHHVEFDARGRLMTTQREIEGGHCPSVTVLFESAARRFQSSSVGVLLTGMGQDGAEGMKSIHDQGGVTIAQNEESSIVFGMPRRAIELGAARYVLPLADIPKKLRRVCKASAHTRGR